MLYGILIALQLIIAVLLVVVILLQSSKGGALAGIAGGALSSTVFGGRGAATFLSRATTVLAALFMINCLAMAVISKSAASRVSVTQQAVATEPTQSPVPPMGGSESATPAEGQPSSQTPAPSGN